MAESTRADAPRQAREAPARAGLASSAALAAALLGLVAFWWAATGVTIAMERDALTRAAGLAAATGLAALAVTLLRATRDVETPAAAFRSFAAGSLLWLWISTLFYGGWVTGVRPADAVAAGPSMALAVQAIAGTLHADLLALGVIALALRLTWRAPNRVGLWALVLFWGAHQTGKLNVFFGVRHAGAEFLPRELAYLARFFGPPVNSPLLPATVLALAVLAALLVWRAVRAQTPFARAGSALLGTLAALALLEHVLLGVELTVPLWDAFLRARNA